MILWVRIGVFLLGSSFTSVAQSAPLLRDIGVFGLMSHDIFAWDNENSRNTENGRLDLSTIFDFDGGKAWQKGGNPKNCENAPVCTVTMQLVDFYKAELENGDSVSARKETVKVFQEMVKDSYTRLSGLPIPAEATFEAVTNTEQAVLRAMHDLLPGKVKLIDRPLLKTITLTDFRFAKFPLNEDELNQEIPTFDGEYDQEYREIKIPFANVTIDLKEVDRKFIETYSPYKQADMLSELARAGSGEIAIHEVSFMHHVTDLLQKGLCAQGNPWMAKDLPCIGKSRQEANAR